jgi:predicted  nucleic acid-binding Zn-ribbon protein
MWRCGNCGYVWDGEEPPDECPNCGVAKEQYTEIEEKAAELVDRSRDTNSIHMELFGKLEEVMLLAQDGIDENLDPGCVRIFTRAMDISDVLRQSILAELQTHMKKGKWG